MIFAALFFAALISTLGFAWGRLETAQQVIRSHVGHQVELATDLYRATFYQAVLSVVIAAGIIGGSVMLGWPGGLALAVAAFIGRTAGNR